MTRNYDFSNCVRKGNVRNSELHVCYFCGSKIEVGGLEQCTCGMWKCPKCKKCSCDATDDQYVDLILLHSYYCRNYERLVSFTHIDKEAFSDCDPVIVKNFERTLKVCSEEMQR